MYTGIEIMDRRPNGSYHICTVAVVRGNVLGLDILKSEAMALPHIIMRHNFNLHMI